VIKRATQLGRDGLPVARSLKLATVPKRREALLRAPHKEKGSAGFAPRGARNRAAAGGLGGARGPPLVQCVKRDRGDMVPVDEVEKQTLMLEPPCRIRISAFRRRKKASENHTLAQSRHGCPFSHRPIRQPKRVGGHVWRTKAKPLALLLAADGFALFGCVIRVGSLTAPSFIYRGKG